MSWDWIPKAILGLISTAKKVIKPRLAERKAGAMPESVPSSVDEEFLDGALRRLGAIESSDSWWKSAVANVEGVVLRPDIFCRPAVREWLSVQANKDDLKAATRAKLAQQKISDAIVARLVQSYTSVDSTGEHRSYAENAIRIAVAFLQASIQSRVLDPGGVAVLQATVLQTDEKMQEGLAAITEAVSLKKNLHVALRFSEEARCDLGKILRRRASPDQDTGGSLRNLLNDFEDGRRLASADKAIENEVRHWLARVEAGNGHPEVAEALLTQLASASFTVPESAWGLLELSKSQPERALRRLRDLKDMDSQTAMFHIALKRGGALEALAFVDALRPSDSSAFTPTGWNNVCATLFSVGRFDNAVEYLNMLTHVELEQCTHLYYQYAISCLLPMVPRDRYNSVMQQGFSSVVENLLDSPDAERARSVALEAAKKALTCARNADDHLIAERCESGIRSLRLLDPTTRDEEAAAISAQMKDGATAVKLIWLVRVHEIPFDSSSLQRYLAHCRKMGGLTPDQLRAELYLLNKPEQSAELVRFLNEEWNALLPDNSPEALTVMMVQALAFVGDFDGATAFFEWHKADIAPPVADRLDLMLRGARGEDASDRALELFDASNAIEDLVNLVQILEQKKHWNRLSPHAAELFKREPNFETAMLRLRCMRRTKASAAEVNSFLKSTVDLVQQRPEIRSARAWALFEDGDHAASKALNDVLLGERSDSADVALDINIAVRTGDWERFRDISVKALDMRSQLNSQMLLSLAKLVGLTDPERALALAQEAVAQDGNDPAVLLGAHAVAIAARRDDIAMPWVHQAAELSKDKDTGLIRSYSHKELVEFMRGNAESWRHKNEMYRTGQVPIHMAASMFNAPLTQMLVGAPRRNADEADVRRRQPIPIRSGKRQKMSADTFSRIALDITAIFILSELGRLQDVLKMYDTVFISPRVMEMLLSDRQKVVFHQPSRIAEVKPLMGLLSAGQLKVIKDDGDAALVKEVGDEAASLLNAAKLQGGQFVHPGTLFKVGSFMEDQADLGILAALVTDPLDVANALLRESRITDTVHRSGVEVLQRSGSVFKADVASNAPLFIDSLALQYLQQAKLLQPLINSGHAVSVHQSTVEEWQALLATEPQAEVMKTALNGIRLVLRAGLVSGKVRFLTQSRSQRGELNEIALLPVMDLLEDISPVEAAVVDDRMFAENSLLTDSNGVTVPLLSSLDLLDILVARGQMSAGDKRDALHTLRERCFFCIPLPPDDLLLQIEGASVEDGRVLETAELRGIRENFARLHSTDVLCTQSDLAYQDAIWNAGTYVIAKLWSNEAMPVAETVARSNWIVTNIIPDIELAMRFAADGASRIRQVAAAQAGANLLGISSKAERQKAHALWIEESCLSRYLPGNSDVLDELAIQAADTLVRRTQEIAIELARQNR
jgi:hypothetical protein